MAERRAPAPTTTTATARGRGGRAAATARATPATAARGRRAAGLARATPARGGRVATATSTPAASGRDHASSPSAAAETAVEAGGHDLHLPVFGTVTVPPPDHVAWYVGVAALAAIEVVEWPVALLLAAGKALSDNRTHQSLRAFGNALEEA